MSAPGPPPALRILLVEDNPGDARLLREALRESSPGARLVHADRLEAARAAVAEGAFDVVLLDLSLPDAHGMDTVAGMLALAPELPIVVLTGTDDETLAVRAVQAGAQDYLVKGQAEPAVLTRALRYAVERKQLDRERARLLASEREARARAEDAVRARNDVLHVVSHDLGNFLSAIVVNAGVVVRQLPADAEGVLADARARVASIRDLARQMQRLRQDLLDVASIDAGRLSVVPGAVHPLDLLEATRELFAPLAAERAVRLVVDPADGLPEVMADRERILQVLGNLVGNALKFTPERGTITLSAWVSTDSASIDGDPTEAGLFGGPADHDSVDGRSVDGDPVDARALDGRWVDGGTATSGSVDGGLGGAGGVDRTAGEDGAGKVVISVADTGPGIDAASRARVFDRFWTTREGTVGGAGLGLNVARGIVEAHGGRIGLRSVVGRGTTFRFTLPRV
ncbi:MAG: ATP-binding region ATPase domain protein [Gemmatimonadetes bacterium]|nr:ATP-binding region ATPase domain protein [Gemmatimonadota bacterium]